jgi:subtilisin family serine protease
MKRFLSLLLITLLLIAWTTVGVEARNASPRVLPLERSTPLFDLPFNPAHLMVKFHPWTSTQQRLAALDDVGGWVEWDYGDIGWLLVRYDMGISYDEMKSYCDARDVDNIKRLLSVARQTAEEKLALLKANPLVANVDFDWYVQLYDLDYIPNDPYFVDNDHVAGVTTPQQWTSFDIQLPAAWDVTQGSTNVIVAIIDTGTDTDHPDLSDNIARFPGGAVKGHDFVGGKNGTILEIFLPVQQDNNPDVHWNDGVDDGWGLPDPSAGDGNDVFGLPSNDCDLGVFHGSWTASCASAATDNSRGTAGAGFNVKIMPVRCMAPEGNLVESIFASVSVLTMGVNWARDNGADIISMSLGMPAGLGEPAGFHDAIISAYNSGIAVFAASGNSGNFEVNWPGGYNEVFAVGSFSQAHNRADFSTYGDYMDALAGGGQIVGSNLSTAEWIWGSYVASVCDMNNGGPEAGSHGYVAALGTSAACPQAAGVAALVLSEAPNLQPLTLYNVLRQSCLDVEAPGWDVEAGWGILQARNALNLINDPIGLTVTLTPSGSTVIPPGGGNLTYQVQLHNGSTQLRIVDFWTNVTLPNGQTSTTLYQRFAITLQPNQTLTRNLNQVIPGSAPPGSYVMHGYAGFWQGVVKAQGQFNFSKSGADLAGSYGDWACTGWDGEVAEFGGTRSVVSEIQLQGANPNPFNPSTALSYKLQAASHVSLNVYDTAGRLVTTLVNGWREVGTHEVTFDGSGLASGMYLYALTAGGNTISGKMVLMK